MIENFMKVRRAGHTTKMLDALEMAFKRNPTERYMVACYKNINPLTRLVRERIGRQNNVIVVGINTTQMKGVAMKMSNIFFDNSVFHAPPKVQEFFWQSMWPTFATSLRV